MFQVCKDCKERSTGKDRKDCHDTCQRYLEEKRINDEKKEKRIKERALYLDFKKCQGHAAFSIHNSRW